MTTNLDRASVYTHRARKEPIDPATSWALDAIDLLIATLDPNRRKAYEDAPPATPAPTPEVGTHYVYQGSDEEARELNELHTKLVAAEDALAEAIEAAKARGFADVVNFTAAGAIHALAIGRDAAKRELLIARTRAEELRVKHKEAEDALALLQPAVEEMARELAAMRSPAFLDEARRCERCGFSYSRSSTEGCRPGDCSMRPAEPVRVGRAKDGGFVWPYVVPTRAVDAPPAATPEATATGAEDEAWQAEAFRWAKVAAVEYGFDMECALDGIIHCMGHDLRDLRAQLAASESREREAAERLSVVDGALSDVSLLFEKAKVDRDAWKARATSAEEREREAWHTDPDDRPAAGEIVLASCDGAVYPTVFDERWLCLDGSECVDPEPDAWRHLPPPYIPPADVAVAGGADGEGGK